MKQRLILFMLCIILLAGVLYWLIPKATAFFEQVDAMGTAIAEPRMSTATTPTIIPTREIPDRPNERGYPRYNTRDGDYQRSLYGEYNLACGYLCRLSASRSDRL